MKTKQEQIEEILRGFNFHAVHKAMQALDWRWALPSRIPTIVELKKTAKSLLTRCYTKALKNNESFLSTGGFQITAKYDKTENTMLLGLRFVVENNNMLAYIDNKGKTK